MITLNKALAQSNPGYKRIGIMGSLALLQQEGATYELLCDADGTAAGVLVWCGVVLGLETCCQVVGVHRQGQAARVHDLTSGNVFGLLTALLCSCSCASWRAVMTAAAEGARDSWISRAESVFNQCMSHPGVFAFLLDQWSLLLEAQHRAPTAAAAAATGGGGGGEAAVAAHIPDPMLDWMHEKVNVSEVNQCDIRSRLTIPQQTAADRRPVGAAPTAVHQPVSSACT